MELDRDVRVFLDIEAALRVVPDDMVFFDDAQTEEEIFAAISAAQQRREEMTSQEWKAQVIRCRNQYLYAAFTFYGTDVKLRACKVAKEALKELIPLYQARQISTGRLERRLGQIREAMLIAMERGAVA
jgi:hypothetical protein